MAVYDRARINPRNPERTAACQRCGVVYNRSDLQPQYQWSGLQLVDTGYRVCMRCLDTPADFLRTIIIPPDPPPVFDALPNGSFMDSVTNWTIQAPPGASMFAATGYLSAVLLDKAGGFKVMTGTWTATAAMTATASAKWHPRASFAATAGFSATVTDFVGEAYGIMLTNPEEYPSPIGPSLPNPADPLMAKIQILFGDA